MSKVIVSEQPAVEYRDVVGFPGYRVGSDGSVWSCRHFLFEKTGKTKPWAKLKPSVNPISKHNSIALRRSGETHKMYIHHIVLEAFRGPAPDGMVCRHFPDQDPCNNRIENLQWGTQSQNMMDKHTHGTMLKGESATWSKLTFETAEMIRKEYAAGGVSQAALGKKYGVCQSTIDVTVRGKRWVACGKITETTEE